MAKAIMIQGTMSNAGKSIITTALCRIFKQDGYRVAPFKSQNMALNSYITKDGLEMGRAQAVQAQAAGIEPSVLMNPILLKPTTDMGSQVIVKGEIYDNMSAKDYYRHKKNLRSVVEESYATLASENDIIVIEGAGSPAEINLQEDDFVNMGMAKIADAAVLLVGDIDRGGVFAQIYGTVALLQPCDRERIKGVIVNKFRGNVDILNPGMDMLKEKLDEFINIEIMSVMPYGSFDIEDEDSLSDRLVKSSVAKQIDIAVIKLPKVSNFTDINPFERFDNVSVRYVTSQKEIENPDMIIIPGTKSTIADLKWLRESGIEAKILKASANGCVVFGICGGFQMLGERLSDPYNVEGGGEIKGLGLLPFETVFEKEKIRTQRHGIIQGVTGVFNQINNEKYVGYEIHMGKTTFDDNTVIASRDNTYGTYIHGIFDDGDVLNIIIKALCDKKGIIASEATTFNIDEYRNQQYDALAALVRKNLDIEKIYSLLK